MRLLRIEELSQDLRRQWAAGRVWAAHQAPYLASALLALDPVVVDCSQDSEASLDLRAFPGDRDWHVYIDPAVLADVQVGELGFWLLHQVSHLLRQHAARYPGTPAAQQDGAGPLHARTADQRRWNVAGDAEINDDLHTAQLELPKRAIQPSRLGLPDGWTAEQYWDALGTDPEPRPSPALSDDTSQRSTPAPEHDCGSGCDGQQRSWNCNRPGLSAVGARLVTRETARQIKEHARQRGDTPAGWQRWADEILEPSVNWRRLLAAHVRRGAADVTGRVDFTYRRPSRRASAVPDVVLPSLRQPLPQVALVIDTSGSMSDSMLGQALGEVTGVLRSLGVARRNLRVIACDARAHRMQRVRDLRAIRLEGGGGTDMGAGIDAAAALRPRPDLIIVLTDGYTPWRAAAPPGIRVVVGLMDRGGTTPDWAQAVLIGSSAGARL
ncbi:MAG: VWA-like domain-containing protein [Solirubrobacteraceae bacterium]